jgi:hypothetical protein
MLMGGIHRLAASPAPAEVMAEVMTEVAAEGTTGS